MSIARRAEAHYLGMGLALMCWLSGCLESRTTRCGELYCPEGTTCASGLDRCVPPASLAACLGLEDGASCTLPESSAAQCVEGVCLAVTCGDGLVMLGEVCDDGNTVSCDGCSGDCHSTEGCGNGRVECKEECDDGPSNAATPNASCRPGCYRQRCGDGVVDKQSGEDCDGAPPPALDCHSFGYYGGTLGCSKSCSPDVAGCVGRCGDGVADSEELCDGAPPGGQTCLDFGYDVGNVYCGRLCTPTFNTCGRMGFSPMTYSGGGVFLNAAWGSSPSDVFAAGYAGSMLHYDGTSWTAMATGVDVSLYGVTGTSHTDVWAVGKAGTVLHFDGGSWAVQVSGTDTQLNTVWAYGPRDIFVGGRVETLPDGGEASLVLYSRGNGTWTRQRLPVRDGGEPYRISTIWGTSPTDVFAVGPGEVVHFDGGSWSFMSVPEQIHDAGIHLYSVWGSGPKDVFAVGGVGTILHYDGQAWTQMDAGVTSFLNAVDGTGPNDVYVVGDEGVALHYNGAHWASLSSNSAQSLVGLSVRGDQAIAVGTGTLTRFERGGPVTSVIATGMIGAVTAFWSDGPSNVVAVTDEGEIAQFNGKSWSSAFSAEASLWSIWASGPNDIFAVGGDGTIIHYGGPSKGWAVMDSPQTAFTLNWVWGSGPNDVYAVGSEGTLLRYNGASWSSITTGTTADLYGVWGSSASDVYAVGTGGTVLHRDGAGWSELQTGTSVDFWAVWGANANEVLLFADLNGVYRLDGTTAVPTTVRSLQSFTFGAGTSPTNVFSVEYQGQGVSHFDGVDWASLRIPAKTLYGVYAKGNRAYVGAAGGEILEIEQLCASKERHCSDRWDDDCDGLLNCADPDCAQASSCAAGGLCQAVDTLSCNSATSDSTAGGSPMLERYGCVPWVEAGRERAHRFVAPASGKVTLELSSAAELDVIVVGAFASGACDPHGLCLGAAARQSGTRQVTFDAIAGKTYWVMVDGPASVLGAYGLQVNCP